MLVTLALLLQIFQAPAPIGEPSVPEFVVVYAEWNDCTFTTSVSKCEVGWVAAADTALDLADLMEKLGGSEWTRVPTRYSFGKRRFVGVWSLRTGKKVQVRIETRERSTPERIEARTWTEKRVVIEQ
jgi:hypothetical protein